MGNPRISYYENGQMKSEGTLKDGKENGLQTEWYKDGQKKREINFKDDERTSEKWWNEDGSVNY